MSETTTAVKNASDAVVNKAAAKAGVAAAAVSEALPTVIETAELGLEVPTKVALNQGFVVAASVIAGAALGAGALWGFNKWRSRNTVVIEVPETVADAASE